MPSTTYPLDITGLNSANRVVDELHTVQIPTGALSAFIVPNYAPFNGDNVTVKHGAPGSGQTTLVKGTDYVLRHEFRHARVNLGKAFYGSIVFINRNISGPVYVTYNTLGGVYVLDSTQIIIDRTNDLLALNTVLWDQIVGVPEALPPVAHTHPADELLGWNAMIAALGDVADAINDPDRIPAIVQTMYDMLVAHIADESNPHNTTKGHVQLPNVSNYPPANDTQARDETNNTTVTTPRGVYQSIVAHFADLLQPHVNDHSLHPQSPADIGLGNVPNYSAASLVQAYAGTADNKLMLPNLMKAAVIGAFSAPVTSTIPSQFLGLSCRIEGSNTEAPVTGTSQWLVINYYSGSLTAAPTLTTQRYQIALSLGSGTGFNGLYFRVQNNATPQAWMRLDGGTRATETDVYQRNSEAYLTPDTVEAALNKAQSNVISENGAQQFTGPVGYFSVSDVPDGAATWKIENVYATDLVAAPDASTARTQVATEIYRAGVTDDGHPRRTYTRFINGATVTAWVQSGSNLTNVPNWGVATQADMARLTNINDKFVSPLRVRQYTENRFGTFLGRVTASSDQPGDPSSAQEGDVHFQIS